MRRAAARSERLGPGSPGPCALRPGGGWGKVRIGSKADLGRMPDSGRFEPPLRVGSGPKPAQGTAPLAPRQETTIWLSSRALEQLRGRCAGEGVGGGEQLSPPREVPGRDPSPDCAADLGSPEGDHGPPIPSSIMARIFRASWAVAGL